MEVGGVDVGKARAFVKEVAKIDTRDEKSVLLSRFNYYPLGGGEPAGCAGTSDALLIRHQIVGVDHVVASFLVFGTSAVRTCEKNINYAQ